MLQGHSLFQEHASEPNRPSSSAQKPESFPHTAQTTLSHTSDVNAGPAQPQGINSSAINNTLPQANWPAPQPAREPQPQDTHIPQNRPQFSAYGDARTKTHSAPNDPAEASKRTAPPQDAAHPQLQGQVPLPRFGPNVLGAPQVKGPYPPRGPPAQGSNQYRPSIQQAPFPQGLPQAFTATQAAHLAQRNSSPQLGPGLQQQGPLPAWGLPPPVDRQGSGRLQLMGMSGDGRQLAQPQGLQGQGEQKHYSRAGQKLLMLVRLGDLKLPATVRKPHPPGIGLK